MFVALLISDCSAVRSEDRFGTADVSAGVGADVVLLVRLDIGATVVVRLDTAVASQLQSNLDTSEGPTNSTHKRLKRCKCEHKTNTQKRRHSNQEKPNVQNRREHRYEQGNERRTDICSLEPTYTQTRRSCAYGQAASDPSEAYSACRS